MSDNDLIQKGQDDLIRRGDALKAIRLGDTVTKIQARIAAIPAVDADPVCTDCGGSGITYQTERRCACQPSIPAVQPTVSPELLATTTDVAALVEAVIMLNAACDAMWNDHERLEKNPDSFGQKYRLKETHLRAISEAQQNLPLALARVKSKEGFSDEKG